MAQAVDRDTLGGWLLKCNPRAWDFAGFLRSGEPVTSWSVQPNYRAQLMAPGDPVLFWVSGDGRDGIARGIWGLGRITAAAEPWSDRPVGFWRDEQGRRAVRARVPVDITLFDEPVTVAELRARGLGDLEVLKMPQGSNPSWVTREQLAGIEELLPDPG